MKPIVSAILLSLMLHLLAIYFMYQKKVEIHKEYTPTKIEKKSNIHYVRLQPKQKPQPIAKKPKQDTPKKKTVNNTKQKEYQPVKKIVKQAKRKVIKKPKKIQSKKTIQPNYEKLNPTQLQKQTLDAFLSTPKLNTEYLDKMTQSYIDLYGEEYNSFTKVQKVFIKNNIQSIIQITRNYYQFPRIAIDKRINGKNVVEFTLHPNGDISGLKIKTASAYSFYDKSIIETIEIAYKDYPRPTQPTKIIFYLTYTVR